MTGEKAEKTWIDRHGDVWRIGSDGLMHTPETAPFSREHVERKWGPLRLVNAREHVEPDTVPGTTGGDQ